MTEYTSKEYIFHIFILDKKALYEAQHCHCGIYDKYPTVNSYCKKWIRNYTQPVCLLKGRSSSRFCNGARNIRGTDIYLTSDQSICNVGMGKDRTKLINLLTGCITFDSIVQLHFSNRFLLGAGRMSIILIGIS